MRLSWNEIRTRALDRLYAPKGFTSDFERVAHLFGLYEKLTAPLEAAAAKPKTRRQIDTFRLQ